MKWVVAPLLLLSMLVFITPLPYAHAVTVVVQRTSATCSNTSGPVETTFDCTANFTNPIASGDQEVAGYVLDNQTEATCLIASTCSLNVSVITPLSAQTLGQTEAGGTQYGQLVIDKTADTTGSTTAQFEFALSDGENITITAVDVYAWETNGIDPAGFSCPGSGDCATTGSGTAYTISPTAPGADSSFLYVGITTSEPSGTLTPHPSYTTVGTYSDGFHVSVAQDKVVAVDNLAINGTISPISTSYLEVGEVFGITSSSVVTVQVTQVVSCNFFQLQCWWLPITFYGMYSGLWVGVGATMRLRARSMTYLFGAAVSYASVYLILLGELPYPFAIMAFIGAFAYGLRLDGVF